MNRHFVRTGMVSYHKYYEHPKSAAVSGYKSVGVFVIGTNCFSNQANGQTQGIFN